ncbi:G-protein coupled receptor 143-like [Coccinella septempunctata]|uniref:G-protein coupled receptor 143-like n=1 Tax=Coccinella septempunctata TaxID=41139 RepID=UPI001D07B6F1|nr:G-protein coupled receptor 143-like [Coccinella septempunctata]
MADPTMQTFCCHRGNGTDVSLTLMKNLNTDIYNTICIISSILGILGALYQILPRKQFSKHHKWLTFSAQRGRRITVLLAVADLMASLGVFLRSIIWLKFHNILPVEDDDSSVIFCTLSSALVQYFYTATWIWTFCYALDMQFVLKDKEINFNYYHLIAWMTPLFTTSLGLSVLYIPDANCHVSKSILTVVTRILPNYLVTYIPIAIIMIYNPVLYNQSTRDMERIITSLTGQFTAKEREIVEGVRMKFFLINLVFYVCWTPNLINGILLWLLWFDVPMAFISIVWYIMAALNPLQAFFNCMVYRRWNKGSEKIITPWSKSGSRNKTKPEISSSSGENLEEKDEALPLLRNVPTTSINQFV